MEQVMSYREFIEEFKKRVLENPEWGIKDDEYVFFPEGFKARNEMEQEFIRETNMKYYLTELDVLLGDFVVLQKWKNEGLISGNRYCLKKMYEEYLINGWENILNAVDANISIMKNKDVDDATEAIKYYEKIKDRLFVRPLNYTDYKYTLKNALYKVIGDIALVIYVKLEDSGENLLSCKMDKNLFLTWGISEDAIFNVAMENSNMMAPPRLYFNPHDVVDSPYYKGAFMEPGSKIYQIKKFQVPVLTTTRKLNGAIALFYPGVMEKISELIGGSYYVAFTSIYEVMVHAKGNISPHAILRSLKDVNSTFQQDEILSRKVFCYDNKTKQLTVLEL